MLISWSLVLHLFALCDGKNFLIETKDEFRNHTNLSYDDKDRDYMAELDIKSVDEGHPVELKCVSPREFSACHFSKTNENIIYRIQPKVAFQNERLLCLCDVSSVV